MLTCTAEKRSALGYDWKTETEVVENFDRCALDMTHVKPLDELLSDGGISFKNVSWCLPGVFTSRGQLRAHA